MRWFLALSAVVVVFLAAGQTQPAAQGKELFERRCTGCHALDRDKEGPRLGGVYGRVSGSAPSFHYSDALKNARITWDAESLDKWLADPDSLVPDNDMAFHVESAAERSGIIAYLKEMQ
ncbi:MAG: c-type cytochrome [Bryobacteraceae bacterium]|jgi:cytochrome c